MAPSVETYVISAKGSSQQASLRSERSAQKSSSLKTPASKIRFKPGRKLGGSYQKGNKDDAFPPRWQCCQLSNLSAMIQSWSEKIQQSILNSLGKPRRSMRQISIRTSVCQMGSTSHQSARECSRIVTFISDRTEITLHLLMYIDWVRRVTLPW